jgi:Tfp pilus assembly protein PilZ
VKLYTSRFLKLVALFYLAFPVTYLATASLVFEIPMRNVLSIILSPGFYFLAALGMLSGFGLLEMKRWAWYTFVCTNLCICYNNAILASDYGTSSHRALAFMGSVLVLIAVMIRIAREVRVPYFLPRIRWWESNPRYKLVVPVVLKLENGERTIKGDILDLSMGGCFVKTRDTLALHDRVDLSFKALGKDVVCTGTIVWLTQSAVTHPKGVGVKFTPFSKEQKRQFKLLIQKLKEIATLYRNSRALENQDEFFKKIEEIEKDLSA